MARKSNAAPKVAVNPPAEGAEGILPLMAIHKIVYGAQQHAAPKSIFTPASETERDELLKGGAARELDADELRIAEAGGLLDEQTDDSAADATNDATTGDADAGATGSGDQGSSSDSDVIE